MKKRIVLISLSVIVCCILIFIFAIYPRFQKNNNLDSFQKAPNWVYSLILTYNGHRYDVTTETTKNINKFIGKVSFHGNGMVFNLYSIKNETDKKIAIETKRGYLIGIMEN